MVGKDNSTKIKDKFWIWAGGDAFTEHNKRFGIKEIPEMTQAEGAFYLGVPNIFTIRVYPEGTPAPPFDQYARRLSSLKRVVWSIVGSGGNTESNELDLVCDLATRFPNICGFVMDDFFRRQAPDEAGNIAAYSPPEVKAIKKQMATIDRKLDLWVVLYSRQLDWPVAEHLEQCDVITFWTWHADGINDLERNFKRLEKRFPSSRKALGCYMYNFGDKKTMPVYLMEKQCQLGLQWLQERRIEGLIFLPSSFCSLGLEAVEWTREWIQKVGEKNIKS